MQHVLDLSSWSRAWIRTLGFEHFIIEHQRRIGTGVGWIESSIIATCGKPVSDIRNGRERLQTSFLITGGLGDLEQRWRRIHVHSPLYSHWSGTENITVSLVRTLAHLAQIVPRSPVTIWELLVTIVLHNSSEYIVHHMSWFLAFLAQRLPNKIGLAVTHYRQKCNASPGQAMRSRGPSQ